MKRITSFEIRCLKELLKIYRARIFQREQQIINLELENEELRKQLEESRAKEGKGALENMIDCVAEAVADIGKMFSTMSPDDLKALVEANDHDLDADCPDDCDFDCEHCEHARIDIEEDNS